MRISQICSRIETCWIGFCKGRLLWRQYIDTIKTSRSTKRHTFKANYQITKAPKKTVRYLNRFFQTVGSTQFHLWVLLNFESYLCARFSNCNMRFIEYHKFFFYHYVQPRVRYTRAKTCCGVALPPSFPFSPQVLRSICRLSISFSAGECPVWSRPSKVSEYNYKWDLPDHNWLS